MASGDTTGVEQPHGLKILRRKDGKVTLLFPFPSLDICYHSGSGRYGLLFFYHISYIHKEIARCRGSIWDELEGAYQ